MEHDREDNCMITKTDKFFEYKPVKTRRWKRNREKKKRRNKKKNNNKKKKIERKRERPAPPTIVQIIPDSCVHSIND